MINEKKINRAGGITIPSHIRREYGIKSGEKFNIKINDEGDMVLKRIVGSCVICHCDEGLIKINDKYVCKECLEALNTMTVVDINEGVEK